jgi:hypothetical protein
MKFPMKNLKKNIAIFETIMSEGATPTIDRETTMTVRRPVIWKDMATENLPHRTHKVWPPVLNLKLPLL